VPLPGVLATATSPPDCCTMPSTTERPSPMPAPTRILYSARRRSPDEGRRQVGLKA
jgi:hypothetical protein